MIEVTSFTDELPPRRRERCVKVDSISIPYLMKLLHISGCFAVSVHIRRNWLIEESHEIPQFKVFIILIGDGKEPKRKVLVSLVGEYDLQPIGRVVVIEL